MGRKLSLRDIHYDAHNGRISFIDVSAWALDREPNHLLERMRKTHAKCPLISTVMKRPGTNFLGASKLRNKSFRHPAIESPSELASVLGELADHASSTDHSRKGQSANARVTETTLSERILQLVNDFASAFPNLWGDEDIRAVVFGHVGAACPKHEDTTSRSQVPMAPEGHSAYTVSTHTSQHNNSLSCVNSI